jgi:hypothetical protein
MRRVYGGAGWNRQLRPVGEGLLDDLEDLVADELVALE